MSHRIACTLALVLAPAVLQAQSITPPVPTSLSLRDAIELAVDFNPALRQTRNDRSPAAWGVRSAYGAFLPQFTLSGGLNYRGAGRQRFLTAEFNQTSATIGSSYSLGLSMQFSGRTLMQPGVASARLRAADAAIEGAEVNLESSITQQYLAVLQAGAQFDLARRQLERNEEFLRLAQARFDVGQNTLLDVRQAQVARGQSEVALLQADHAVTVEKLRLFQFMGLPAPDNPAAVTLTDTFPIAQPGWELSNLLGEAASTNPDLSVLRAQAASARATERASKSSWLPSLQFSAGWSGFTQQFTNTDVLIQQAQAGATAAIAECEFLNQNYLNAGSTPQNCSLLGFTPDAEQAIRTSNSVFPFSFTSQPFQASLGVSLPLFTQFSRPAEIAQASAQTDDAMEAVRARELQVRTDVSQAYYALRAAYEAIRIQEENRVAAQEQLRLATERYRVGSGTFFELLDAQVAAEQAEADYINAVYTYHRAIATLEAAVGRPLR
jgi:outer membrane protein